MSEFALDTQPAFSAYEVESAKQFIQANEVLKAGEPGELKAKFEDLCSVELGIPTRELAGELWDIAKSELINELSNK